MKWIKDYSTHLFEAFYFSADMDDAYRLKDPLKMKQAFLRMSSINTPNQNGKTPLMLAVIIGDPHLVSFMIQHGAKADVHLDNETTDSALALAVSRKNAKIAKILLDADAKVEHITNRKHNMLQLASSAGDFELVKLAVERGNDVNDAPDYNTNSTPLIMAIKSPLPNLDIIKFLLDNEADPNKKDIFGSNALTYALRLSNLHNDDLFLEIARLLVNAGADASKAFKTLDDFMQSINNDPSRFPGDIEEVRRKFRANEIRKKLF